MKQTVEETGRYKLTLPSPIFGHEGRPRMYTTLQGFCDRS